MAKQYVINDLDEILEKKVISYTTKVLTAPGENYGSLMLDVCATVENEKGEKDELNLVAKLFPESKYMQEFFCSFLTFKKEIGLYKDIVPALQELNSTNNSGELLNMFPSCYGARINANCGVLLLENMKKKGYDIYDMMVGFDFETTRLIVKNLAVFHALPVALKLKKPEVFNKKVLPHLQHLNVFESMSEEGKKAVMDSLLNKIKNLKEVEHLYERIVNGLFAQEPTEIQEPYATLVHNDFWVNNTMIKTENGKAVNNIFVDFQTIIYGSPANDLIFFLFSSVQRDVIEAHYNDFIKTYHEVFVKTLHELNCDTTPFTFDLFLKEIDLYAHSSQFRHVLFMLRPIYTDKKKMENKLSEFSEEDFLDDGYLSDLYPKRLVETILTFAKHNWI